MTEKYCRVRDHCNHSGQYSVNAHSICNLRYQIPKKLFQFYATDQTMIMILVYKGRREI